jgi:hypothetical protein
VYFTVGGLAIVLVFASLVAGLWFRRTTERPLPNPGDMLACHADVRRLLERLGEMTAELHRETVKGEAQDVLRRWRTFAREWQDDWVAVNTRCQFDELADTDQNVAFESMARVHRELITIEKDYDEMMERFGRAEVAEVARLRELLDRSLVDLERAGGAKP